MQYKIIGNLHLWGWVELKEELNANLIDYKNNGNKIVYQILETKKSLTEDDMKNIIKKFQIKIEVLK